MLAREGHRKGLRVAAVDKIYGQGMDILKPSGYGTLASI